MILLSSCRMNILKSALSAMKLKLIKNTTNFWFHNLSDYLRSYMLFNSYITSFCLIALKNFIHDGNFMKIGKLLFVSRLLRYTSTISIWSTNNPNKQKMARNMHSNSLFTIKKKVSLKSILCSCKKSCTTSFALY